MTVSLLATKLHIPPTPPNIIHRERLLELLNSGLQRKLIVLSAPAGYGKTTLLSEWICPSISPHLPAAWLSLDAGDNDAFRFWSYLFKALCSLVSREEQEASLTLSPSTLSEEALVALINRVIVAIPQDFILVLDDYHWITNSLIHQSITFLLDYSPARMHVVISGREEPPLHLALLRARDQLVEIGRDELCLTLSEAKGFVRRLSKMDLSPDALEILYSRTEGWIAGLQLVMLSMRGQADVENFLSGLTGSQRYIADFLIEEILQRQPDPIRSFLLQTSILDRMCAPLCDRVFEMQGMFPNPLFSDFQQLLEYLERTNLFTVPLDDIQGWFRYHHLFSDVLRGRLMREQPERVLDIHRKAAEWFIENGYREDALDHWLAAGDVAKGSRLVVQYARNLLSQGEVSVLLNWMHKLPDAQIRSNPWLSIYYAAGLMLTGQPQRTNVYLASAELNVPANQSLEARDMRGHIASLRAQMAIELIQVEEALEQAGRALEYLPDGNLAIRSLVNYTLGNAHMLNNDVGEADKAFANAALMGQESMNIYMAIAAYCAQARVKMFQGRLSQADRYFQVAQRLSDEPSEYRYRMMDYGYAWMADLRREMNAIPEAQSIVTEAMEYFSKKRSMDAMLCGYNVLARIHLSTNNPDIALDALNKAQSLTRKYNLDQVNLLQVQACQVRALIQKGDLKQAALCLEGWQNGTPPPIGLLHHLQTITRARLFLAQGEIWKALAMLEPIGADAQSKGLDGTLIEVLVLEALAYSKGEDRKSSSKALEKALRLAAPEGFIRIFLDEGAPFVKLLYSLSIRTDERIKEYVDRLLAAFQKEEKEKLLGKMKTPQLADAIETLNERELQILSLIAEGKSYQEIAQILIIAISTVQHYIKSLYAKLQVHSGLEAVAHARQLGILP